MARGSMIMKLLVSIVATTMLLQSVLAVDHDVGAPGGWDTSTDLKSWASSKTFTVGDNLVFTFSGTHNVEEVSKDDYESCSANNAKSRNSISPTTISLKEAGSRYFICGTAGHCDQGMKVEIKTVAAAASGPPPSTTTSPPTSSESPAPPSYLKPAPPADSTPGGEPVQGDETVKPSPSPSSAATVKMTVVSVVGIGFLMMI